MVYGRWGTFWDNETMLAAKKINKKGIGYCVGNEEVISLRSFNGEVFIIAERLIKKFINYFQF